MELVAFLFVLAVAGFAVVAVAAGYVVWVRIVGLDPTLARQVADRPRWQTAPPGLLLGGLLGAGLRVLPSIRAGVAAVCLLASSTFAGLLLFELYAQRRRPAR